MRNALRFAIVLGLITIASALGLSGVYQLTKGRIAAKHERAFEAALQSIFPEADEFLPLEAVAGHSGAEAADGAASGEAAAETSEGAAASAEDGGGQESWDGSGVGVALSGAEALGYLSVGEKQGYSSTIRVLVGCTPDYTVKAVRILSQSETPGLGERTREVKTDRTIWQAAGEALGLAEGKSSGEAGERRPWFQKQFSGLTLDELVVVKDPSGEGVEAITGATVTSTAVTEAVKEAVERIRQAVERSADELEVEPRTQASPADEGGRSAGAAAAPAGRAGETSSAAPAPSDETETGGAARSPVIPGDEKVPLRHASDRSGSPLEERVARRPIPPAVALPRADRDKRRRPEAPGRSGALAGGLLPRRVGFEAGRAPRARG